LCSFIRFILLTIVLPVEIETPQGLMTLSLGYNNLENPFDAAQRFIDENSLDQNHLRQIADWISSRAGKNAPTLDMGAPRGSGSGALSSGTSSSASAPPSKVQKKYQFIPLAAFAVQDDVPSGLKGKVLPKIAEFNTAEGDVLSAGELDAVGAALDVLATTSYYHSSSVTDGQISCIAKLTTFATSRVFPGFDICRMLALHPAGSQSLAGHPQLSSIITRALTVLQEQEREPGNAAVTALRFLMNSFRFDGLRRAILSSPSLIAAGNPAYVLLQSAAPYLSCSSKLARAASSALLVNIVLGLGVTNGAVIPTAAEQQQLQGCTTLLLSLLERTLMQTQAVEEIFRSLVALGTLLLSSSGLQAVEQARKMGIDSTLDAIQVQLGDKLAADVRKCIEEVSLILRNGP
jgi:phospholipase A-2-activating protein